MMIVSQEHWWGPARKSPTPAWVALLPRVNSHAGERGAS